MNPVNAIVLVGLLLGTGTAPAADSASPTLAEFAWRAPLVLPAGASAGQLSLPAEALLQLRSATAKDIRIFNADGEAVAMARIAPPARSTAEAIERTPPFIALPLMVSTGQQQPSGNAVRVQMELAGNQGAVWVQMGSGGQASTTGTSAAPMRELPAVLLDTRSEKRSITALQVNATLPANSLVNMTLSRSADLVHWTAVPVKGPLYRFDGAGAPDNRTLALQQPLSLQDQYLRLQWDDATAGIRVQDAVGLVQTAHQPASPVDAPLAGAVAEGSQHLTWPIEFVLPMVGLQLQTSRANTLVPVRILGRRDTSQAWTPLAQGVVYRMGPNGDEKTNAAIPLNSAGMRWLRVEASHGMALPAAELSATAQFNPVQLVFLASGPAPFMVAVGRPDTASATVDPSVLRTVVTGALDRLPMATPGPGQIHDISHWNDRLMGMLTGGGEQRKVILWLVLAVGVLALGAVAFALLRQLPVKPTKTVASE
jgi:hypothetical protein